MRAFGPQLSQALFDVSGVLADRVKRAADIVASVRRTLALSRSCISSHTVSCSQRRTRRSVRGVHCDFNAQPWHFELQ